MLRACPNPTSLSSSEKQPEFSLRARGKSQIPIQSLTRGWRRIKMDPMLKNVSQAVNLVVVVHDAVGAC